MDPFLPYLWWQPIVVFTLDLRFGDIFVDLWKITTAAVARRWIQKKLCWVRVVWSNLKVLTSVGLSSGPVLELLLGLWLRKRQMIHTVKYAKLTSGLSLSESSPS